MNLVAIVDSDEGRRNALRTLCVSPEVETVAGGSLRQVRGLTNERHVTALFLPWVDGGKELTASAAVGWDADYVVPILLQPYDLAPDERRAQEQQADAWSKLAFPQAHVRSLNNLNVGDFHRVLVDILHNPKSTSASSPARTAPTRPPASVTGTEAVSECPKPASQASCEQPVDEERAGQLLGSEVKILKLLDKGATCSVFLGLNSHGQGRIYKLARTAKHEQFEAMKAAVSLVWDTSEGAQHLLPTSVYYCQDRRYFFIVNSLLDDITGGRFDLGRYEQKTLLRWLQSLPRHSNGTLDKRYSLKVLSFLAAALKGLSFLHRKGFAYNDIHPGNLGFFDNRPVWIDHSAITLIGNRPHEGCVYYAAPEGREATPAHDCFSLAKMLIGALTEMHPAEIQPIRIEAISQNYFRGTLEVLGEIACKGLAVDPDERYQSAAELAQALRGARRVLSRQH